MWAIGAVIAAAIVIWCLVFLWNHKGFILRLIVAIVALALTIAAIQNVQYWGPPLLSLLSTVGTVLGVVLGIVVALAVIGGIAVLVLAGRTVRAERLAGEAEEKQRIAVALAANELEQAQLAQEAAAAYDPEQERLAQEAAKAAATHPDLYAGVAQATDVPDTIYGGR